MVVGSADVVVVEALIPIFSLILLGYVLGIRGWLPTQTTPALTAVTFKLFMPVLLFSALARADLAGALSPLLLLVYYLPALLVFTGVNLIMHRRLGKPTAMGLAASYSNNVLVGIPLITTLLGTSSLVYLFAVLAFHSVILFTAQSLYNAFCGSGDRFDIRSLLRSLANPLIIGLFLGALLNLSGMGLPAPVWRLVDWLAAAALPCALLVLGLSLSHYRLRLSPVMLGLTLAKLLVLPALVLGAGLLMGNLGTEARTVLLIMAACPTGVNVLAFAMGGEDNRIVGSAIFLSTVMSAVTLPLWLLLLN